MKEIKLKGIILITFLYLITTIILLIYNAKLYTNFINPLYFTIISTYLLYYKNNFIVKVTQKKYIFYTIIISIIFSILYFYLGFIFGFTKSPFSHKFIKIITNIIKYIIPIIGIELTRFTVINKNKNNKLVIIFISIILTLLEIKYNVLIDINLHNKLLFKYICSNIIPLIFKNVLFTYINQISFYPLSLVFRIIDKLLILLLPIIPSLNWFITGSIKIIKILIIYITFNFQSSNIIKRKENYYVKKKCILTLFLTIMLVCFMLGMFKYQIIAILSNSMDPIFNKADAVIYKKVDTQKLNDLKVNTIIVYKIDDKLIVHRIIKKVYTNNQVEYVTKGDANNKEDYKKVKVNQIQGIYVFHIKYLGYPSVLLNEYFNYK